jgi:hypothetical protein
MRKRPRSDDYDLDRPWLPSLTVYEPEAGLKRQIGFVRFQHAAKRAVRLKKRPAAKRK